MTSPVKRLAKVLSKGTPRTPISPAPTLGMNLATIVEVTSTTELTVMLNGALCVIELAGDFFPSPGDTVVTLANGTQVVAICPFTGSPLRNNPAGTAYCTSGATLAGGVTATLNATGPLYGGMGFTSQDGTGLVIPYTGAYLAFGQVKLQPDGSTCYLEAGIMKNGATMLKRGAQTPYADAYLGSVVAGKIDVNAGDVINLWYNCSDNDVGFQIDGAGQDNFLDLVLASTAPAPG